MGELAQIASCSQINTKHINNCGQCVQLSNVKFVGLSRDQ
jgi:hypothetical protein